MNGFEGQTLGYRTDGPQLLQFIETLNRRGSIDQVSQVFSSSGAFQGTVLVAQHLGFVDMETEALGPRGRDYLLRQDLRPDILLAAILEFDPYGLLLDSLFARGNPTETTMEWMANWWAAGKYGASQNNREEAATSLAKILESAGLGNFMIGRRGRPTRIMWAADAAERLVAALHGSKENDETMSEPAPTAEHEMGGGQPDHFDHPDDQPTSDTSQDKFVYYTTPIPLGKGKVVQLKWPSPLTQTEKTRLFQIMDLMLFIEEEASAPVVEE